MNDIACWFDEFRGKPFPVEALPPDLANYIMTHAAHYGVDTSFAALSALVQLAGILGENGAVRSLTGNRVPVLLRAIIATPSGPGYSAAATESLHALEELQNERVEAAAGLDRARIKQLKHTPSHRLPGYARPSHEGPADQGEARLHVLNVLQKPCFLLHSPGARELRHGFASSHDRTLLVTGNILKQLMGRDRAAKQLADLLARACQGGQIDVPCAGKQMIQPRVGILCVTDDQTLEAAIASSPDVQTVTRHCILLNAAAGTTLPTATYAGITEAGAYWKHTTRMLHESRLSLAHGYAPHPCFHVPLIAWPHRLQALSTEIPELLQPYLGVFADLPIQLASLFLAIHFYGGPGDQLAAESAITVADWLMAQTLITVTDARANAERATAVTAGDEMLAKITEHGPVSFWRLVRHYHDQDPAVHTAVLDSLLEQGRVRSNESGQLLAA